MTSSTDSPASIVTNRKYSLVSCNLAAETAKLHDWSTRSQITARLSALTGNYTVSAAEAGRVRLTKFQEGSTLLVDPSLLASICIQRSERGGLRTLIAPRWVSFRRGTLHEQLFGNYDLLSSNGTHAVLRHWDTLQEITVQLSYLQKARLGGGSGALAGEINLNSSHEFVDWRVPRELAMVDFPKGTQRAADVRVILRVDNTGGVLGLEEEGIPDSSAEALPEPLYQDAK